MKCRLVISPNVAQLDQEVIISVEGLASNEKIYISAELIDELNRVWKSEAIFTADVQGKIDLSKQAPLSGSYTGIDAMGLFWSMILDDAEANYGFFKWRSLNPMIVKVCVTRSAGQVLEGHVTRQIVSRPFNKISVSEKGLVANLFIPTGEALCSPVIVMGGAGETVPDAFVMQFVNHGYAALGLAYHSYPGLPPDARNIPVEYVYEAIKWLKNRKDIRIDQLSVVGYSMGGVYALLAASYYSEIKVVVSLSGRGVIPQAVPRAGTRNLDEGGFYKQPTAVFTAHGKSLPFLPVNKSVNLFGEILHSLTDSKQCEESSIKVENIKGAILMVGGIDDRFVAAGLLQNIAYNRLVKNNFPNPYEFLIYKGTGHLMAEDGLPYQPTTIAGVYVDSKHPICLYGGNPKDQACACLDMYKRMFGFLKEHLA